MARLAYVRPHFVNRDDPRVTARPPRSELQIPLPLKKHSIVVQRKAV